MQFQNGLYEDVMWSYWFAYSCKTTLVIDARIYYYRQHPKSILGSTSSRHMELLEQQKKTLELFKLKSAPAIMMSIIQSQILAHAKYILFKTERIPKDLQKVFCEQMITNAQSFLSDAETEIKKKNTEKQKLDQSIKELISIKILSHPIKKYKQYKKLLKIYYGSK